jgi:hypothetical protein
MVGEAQDFRGVERDGLTSRRPEPSPLPIEMVDVYFLSVFPHGR